MTHATQIALEHGYQVEAKQLPQDVVAITQSRLKTIIVNSMLPEYRQNFGICHELAHIQLKHTQPYTFEMEEAADKLAAEILLGNWEIGSETDLHKLKKKFPHVSYEFLAMRLADRGHRIAIYDNGNLKTRNGLISKRQGQIVKAAFVNKMNLSGQGSRAYYVPPNGTWERVILVEDSHEKNPL